MLRKTLMNSAANFWRVAERNIDGLPPCPSDTSNPQYVVLVFLKKCSVRSISSMPLSILFLKAHQICGVHHKLLSMTFRSSRPFVRRVFHSKVCICHNFRKTVLIFCHQPRNCIQSYGQPRSPPNGAGLFIYLSLAHSSRCSSKISKGSLSSVRLIGYDGTDTGSYTTIIADPVGKQTDFALSETCKRLDIDCRGYTTTVVTQERVSAYFIPRNGSFRFNNAT
jgi:hypothetical protein